MGPVQQQLSADVKVAMKAREKERLQLLRMLINDLKQEQLRTGKDELRQEEEFDVLRKAAKMRVDAIESAVANGRDEFAAKERAELEIIEACLPQMMDEAQTELKVRELLAELGITERKDQGRFMKEWMARYKFVSDGKLVNQFLARELA